MRRVLFFLVLCLTLPAYSIVINEIVAANNTINTDVDGDYSDWLELYNDRATAINLNGFSLTDDATTPQRWTFPEVMLQPGGFVLVWCSGKENAGSELHANFKLSRDGETVLLSSSDGALVDSLTFPAIPADFSYARVPDGSSTFVLTSDVTPAAANSASQNNSFAAAPTFSQVQGFYDDSFTVELATATTGADIYYTLDTSDPDRNSARYTNAVPISGTTIIRAVAIKSDMQPSAISTHTFFNGPAAAINELPVLSLVTDPDNLWDDETGIYANPLESGDEWERPISVEFFEKGGEVAFSTGAGIRIHGGASRMPEKSAKKSFRLYFRSEYGVSELDYQIISTTERDKFDRLVLRAGFNDAWIHWLDLEREQTTYVRDQLVRDVYHSMGHPASHGEYAHLYLNGEYWGLYNISERYDDDFGDQYIGGGDWDIIKPGDDSDRNAIEATEGDLEAWDEFNNWFSNTSLTSSAKYETLKSYVDLPSFIDFYILNIYGQNYDWPRHNWYAIRNRDNGLWIFLPWDSEYAFGSGNQPYSYSMNMWNTISGQTSYPLPLLYDRLKSNSNFREDVATRFSELITNEMSQANVLALLETRLEQVRSAIPFEAERWGSVREPDVYGYDDWLAAAESMRDFIRNRTSVLMGQMAAEGFSLPSAELPDGWRNLDVGDVGAAGFVTYNDGLYTITGSGLDIWGTNDEFHYIYKSVSGDVDVRTRVLSVGNTDEWAKAGIMIREVTSDAAKNVYVAATPQRITFQRRVQVGGETVSTKVEETTAPRWLRLVREGDEFTAYESPDGETWNVIDRVTFSMRSSAQIGLAVTAHNDGALCTATIDNFSINGVLTDTAGNIDVPESFVLLQNYPNPFNPETTIEFNLPNQDHVDISIYDVTGKLIRQLVDESMPAGSHHVRFNAENLASGVYIARLKTSNHVENIKMMLVR